MFSQTEKEMLNAGIKKSTVKRIFKKFEGNIEVAIESWASSGAGHLSKKFIKNAKNLGFNEDYLNSKLKQARSVRLKMIAAGVQGFAEGYSNAMENSNENTTPTYTTPTYTTPTYTTPTYTTPTYTAPTYTTPTSGDYYSKNQYGIMEKTGEVRENITGDGYDVYGKNKWGIQEKTGEINKNIIGDGYDVYGKNKWGIQEKKKEYRKNIIGDGYDVYEKNKWGIMEKTGEVKKIPSLK